MKTTEAYAESVAALLEECKRFYGERLVSFCLFGSVARQTMNNASDIDFLLVLEPLPDGRMARVREFDGVEKELAQIVTRLRRLGFYVQFSPIFKTRSEVREGSLLFLDMVDDGKILFDRDDFLSNWFSQWRRKLAAQGARKVRRGDSWYWILKEPYAVGEEFEI